MAENKYKYHSKQDKLVYYSGLLRQAEYTMLKAKEELKFYRRRLTQIENSPEESEQQWTERMNKRTKAEGGTL